ncbi:MAG: TonB-dependent receptor domain-containing protein [Acidobacteriota bacterium]
MRMRFWSPVILIAFLGFGADRATPTELAQVRGWILDPDGDLVAGASVTLGGPGDSQQKVITDLDGFFRFDGLPEGSYVLLVRASGFTHTHRVLDLAPGEELVLPVLLERTGDPNEPSAQPTGALPNLTIHERVTVIGDASRLGEIPGSAYLLDAAELDKQKQGFDDIHRILRQVPGVIIQEEEGYGLRPNIGMRGTGTERSSKVTLMEDGVLIAPAPYAAPAAYYFPTTGRMRSVEVRKGSSQIKYGPRTNGGVLNMVSTGIPDATDLDTTLVVGEDATRKIHVALGDSYRNFGWLFETYRLQTKGYKQLDGGGSTGFDVEDYLGKLRFNTSAQSKVYQSLEIKLGRTDQQSDETYLGLTDEDFRRTPLRRYVASQLDNIESEHQQYQAQHFLALPNGLDVTTTVYRNNFQRNWYKLQSIAGTDISRIFDDTARHVKGLAIARGAASGPDALKVRANNREYFSHGVQSIVGLKRRAGGAEHDIELGFRYSKDQEDRFQHEDGFQMVGGQMMLTSRGAPGSQSNRVSDASAWAFFVQDRIQWDRWSVAPGVRYEAVHLLRTDYSKSDPRRISPSRVRTNSLDVVIPGVGIQFDVSSTLGVFGGVHKGFSPPGPGSSEQTEAEESINYELGLRKQGASLHTELVFFFNDYSNLLGTDTLASGGTGEGDLFNGGEVRVLGLEASASYDLAGVSGLGDSVPLRLSYSFTDARFQNSFHSAFAPWGEDQAADSLPYLPRHQFYAGVGVERGRWSLGLNANYTSKMRTRAGGGSVPDAEATDGYLVFNSSGEYRLSEDIRLFVSLQNLTSEEYIVARRPAGARPGLPRTVMAGVKFRLGPDR